MGYEFLLGELERIEESAHRCLEPLRVLWKLQLLREWSLEQEAKQVFPGSPRGRSAPSTRAV